MKRIKLPNGNRYITVTDVELERMKKEGLIPIGTEIVNL